jgi:hypothetical protein
MVNSNVLIGFLEVRATPDCLPYLSRMNLSIPGRAVHAVLTAFTRNIERAEDATPMAQRPKGPPLFFSFCNRSLNLLVRMT